MNLRALLAAPVLLAGLALAACGTTTTAGEAPGAGVSSAAPSAGKIALASPSATAAPKDITLAAPADGATVSGKLAVSGTADSAKGNVPWAIYDLTGDVADQGSFTASGSSGALSAYHGTIDVSELAAGTYTLSVSTDAESDASDGTPAESISRTFNIS